MAAIGAEIPNEDVGKPVLRRFYAPRENTSLFPGRLERYFSRCLASVPRGDRTSEDQRRENSYDPRSDGVLTRAFFEGDFFYSLNDRDHRSETGGQADC